MYQTKYITCDAHRAGGAHTCDIVMRYMYIMCNCQEYHGTKVYLVIYFDDVAARLLTS